MISAMAEAREPYLVWNVLCLCKGSEQVCESNEASPRAAQARQERPLLTLQEQQVLAEALSGRDLPP